MGFRGKERRASRVGCAPPPPWAGPNWTRRGRRPPPSFSPLPPSLLLLVGIGRGGRILLGPGVQVGLPPLARPLYGRPPLPPSFYIRGRGHPKGTPSLLLAVCGAPLHSYTPRSYRRTA